MRHAVRTGFLKVQSVLLLLVMVFSFLTVIGCGSSNEDTTVIANLIRQTEQGLVMGVNEDQMYAFRGIPYAKPPVGARRFATTVALDDDDKWSGIRDAKEFGNVCVQNDGTGYEDCLTLNIFTPKTSGTYPVMVWIHGGALIQGSSSVPGYDLPALVNQGVVVVTINYRLNAFGFLPHPALEDSTGNFGLKDQVMALRWVQANIANFYGDPGNVTIFGESAGGHSVLSLMVSSIRNEGLFHKAIVQSGSYSPTQTPLATVGFYGLGLPFADLPGYPGGTGTGPCAGIADHAAIRTCLRNLTVAEIIATQTDPVKAPAWQWISPVYYPGSFLNKNISQSLTDGDVADVPVMIGSNLNEGSLFTALFAPSYGGFATAGNLLAGVTTLLFADQRIYSRDAVATYYTGQAAAKYGDNPNKFRNAHSMIFTDATFTCNALGHATTLGARQNTYAYWFTDSDAPINPTYAPVLEPIAAWFDLGNWGFGASHSFEIQYIFGSVQEHANVTGDQVALSNRMIAYWTNFAKNGEPGGGWTAYNGVSNMRKLQPTGDTDAQALTFVGAHHCDRWAAPEIFWPVGP